MPLRPSRSLSHLDVLQDMSRIFVFMQLHCRLWVQGSITGDMELAFRSREL